MNRHVRTIGSTLAAIAAWTWALVVGVGGLALLMHLTCLVSSDQG